MKTQLLLWATLAFFCSTLPFSSAADKDDYVDEHNAWRAEVGAPPLVWDNTLAALAQDWAEELRDNNECVMEHSSTLSTEYSAGPMGENLYWYWTSASSHSKGPIDAVLGWAREKVDYNYGPIGDSCTEKNGPSKPVGHYTQLTYTDSRKVGCGRANCNPSGGGTSSVWVCRYWPAQISNKYPFCGKNRPDGMDKCDNNPNGNRPECGTPCGECDNSATPSSCAASIDAVCLTEEGTGWDCSGNSCTATGLSAAGTLHATLLSVLLPLMALARLL